MKPGDLVRLNISRRSLVWGSSRSFVDGEVGIVVGPSIGNYNREEDLWLVMFHDCSEIFNADYFQVVSETDSEAG